jgi:hypothetical protein
MLTEGRRFVLPRKQYWEGYAVDSPRAISESLPAAVPEALKLGLLPT